MSIKEQLNLIDWLALEAKRINRRLDLLALEVRETERRVVRLEARKIVRANKGFSKN